MVPRTLARRSRMPPKNRVPATATSTPDGNGRVDAVSPRGLVRLGDRRMTKTPGCGRHSQIEIDTEAVRLDSRIFRGDDAVSPSWAGVARYGLRVLLLAGNPGTRRV